MTSRITAADVDRLASRATEVLGVEVRAQRQYGGTAVHVVIPGTTAVHESMSTGTARDAHTFLSGMLAAADMPRQLDRWAEWSSCGHSTGYSGQVTR